MVQDLFLKFKSLHMEFKIKPSAASYEKLITHFCELHKVHLALDIADEMCEAGLSLSIDTIHSILHASEESYEYNLVRRIYDWICRHNLKPNCETFRSMISLSVKMKDFSRAYAMLDDLKKFNITSTTSIYNTLMAGYFREGNIGGALSVLKLMKREDIKPDSHTFSYLIGNCNREEDITMVVLDKGIPLNNLNEIKSVLVSALASSGKMSDALNLYKEIKLNGGTLEPKAVISLIEHFTSDGELSILLQLLEELHDMDYWVDGCCRVVSHFIRHKQLRPAIDLLKQLKDKFHTDDLTMEAIFGEIFCVIADRQPNDLQTGLALLQATKDELGLTPSRKSLDFLLASCVNAKDLQSSLLIWNEYQAAGLRCNVLTFLRMYQALLASGDPKSAKSLLTKIPTDDPHVRCIIKACQATYVQSTSSKTKKSKTKKKNKT